MSADAFCMCENGNTLHPPLLCICVYVWMNESTAINIDPAARGSLNAIPPTFRPPSWEPLNAIIDIMYTHARPSLSCLIYSIGAE